MSIPREVSEGSGRLFVNGHEVGTLIGKTLLTYRHSKRHFFRRFNGYGLSVATIIAARSKGAMQVQIEVVDTGDSLTAPFTDFFEKGHKWVDGLTDVQFILPLEKFTRQDRMVSSFTGEG